MPKLKSSCLFTWRGTDTEDPERAVSADRGWPTTLCFLGRTVEIVKEEGGRREEGGERRVGLGKNNLPPTPTVHCAPYCHLVVEE